jgi:hypothetical protein
MLNAFNAEDEEKEMLLEFLKIVWLFNELKFYNINTKFFHYSRAASRKLFHSVGLFLSISMANYLIL